MPIPLSQNEAARLRRAIRRYISAAIDNDNKGGGDPQDHAEIELELRKAQDAFWALFDMSTPAPTYAPPSEVGATTDHLLRKR